MSHYPDLSGKNVVVTGGSGDIGLAICEKYLEQHRVKSTSTLEQEIDLNMSIKFSNQVKFQRS